VNYLLRPWLQAELGRELEVVVDLPKGEVVELKALEIDQERVRKRLDEAVRTRADAALILLAEVLILALEGVGLDVLIERLLQCLLVLDLEL